MSNFLVIELWPHEAECCVCGETIFCFTCGPNYGLAMYEDEILPADWPGEWGGFPACHSCFIAFNDIKAPLTIREARRMVEAARADAQAYPALL